jgi:hypothetical protein
VTPARSAGLTASSEARKRAKGFEPSTFSLGIAFPRLRFSESALQPSQHWIIVPFVPHIPPYFRTRSNAGMVVRTGLVQRCSAAGTPRGA